jgi:hypothetical protein
VVARTLGRDPRLRPSAEQILLTLVGEPGRGNVRAAASRVIDGTWPGSGGVDPTRIGGPTEPPPRSGRPKPGQAGAAGYGAAAGAAAGYVAGAGAARRPHGDQAAYRGGQAQAYRGPRPAEVVDPARNPGPAVDRYVPDRYARPASDERYGQPASPAGRAPAVARQPGAAGRRQWDPYIRYEKAPEPARAAPADPQAAYRPPYQPPAPARPDPAPQPVVRRESPRAARREAPPVARREPRPRRRGFRLRIPFRRTITFVLVVIVLFTLADRIASSVDKHRRPLERRLQNRIEEFWRRQSDAVDNQIGNQIDKRVGDATGSSAPPAPPVH